MLLHWYDTNGVRSYPEGAGMTIATNLSGQWFQLNMDHNLVPLPSRYLGQQCAGLDPRTNGAYFRLLFEGLGELHGKGGTFSEMDTYIKDIQIWTS